MPLIAKMRLIYFEAELVLVLRAKKYRSMIWLSFDPSKVSFARIKRGSVAIARTIGPMRNRVMGQVIPRDESPTEITRTAARPLTLVTVLLKAIRNMSIAWLDFFVDFFGIDCLRLLMAASNIRARPESSTP